MKNQMITPIHFKVYTRDRFFQEFYSGNPPNGNEDLYCSGCGKEIETDLLWISGIQAYCSKCRREQ